MYRDEYASGGCQPGCGVFAVRENRHIDTVEDGGGMWWDVVDMVLTVAIGSAGGVLLAWACLEAMLWAARMGWL